MAEKAKKKNNKNLIIGICAGVLVIAVVVVAIIFATKGTTPAINDAYFVSDGTKYVITLDEDEIESEDEEVTPVKTHIVYTYSGDTITGMSTYMEFTDEATAKAALASYQEAYADTDASESGIASMSTNGKYLVIVATEDQYADTTVSEVKQYVEMLDTMKNADTNDAEDEDYIEEDIEVEDEE
jgi:hypothetical protein